MAVAVGADDAGSVANGSNVANSVVAAVAAAVAVAVTASLVAGTVVASGSAVTTGTGQVLHRTRHTSATITKGTSVSALHSSAGSLQNVASNLPWHVAGASVGGVGGAVVTVAVAVGADDAGSVANNVVAAVPAVAAAVTVPLVAGTVVASGSAVTTGTGQVLHRTRHTSATFTKGTSVSALHSSAGSLQNVASNLP